MTVRASEKLLLLSVVGGWGGVCVLEVGSGRGLYVCSLTGDVLRCCTVCSLTGDVYDV